MPHERENERVVYIVDQKRQGRSRMKEGRRKVERGMNERSHSKDGITIAVEQR
jgi:hypothetical protein